MEPASELRFTADSESAKLSLMPLAQIHGQRYSVQNLKGARLYPFWSR